MSKPSSNLYRFSQQDRVIVVMGPTGAGKSTFINYATGGQMGALVGHQLRSLTTNIQTIRYTHPVDGCPVVFVDTPGFNDTHKSDLEILTIIADWLVNAYKGGANLTTIVYVHAISEPRMTGSHLKNLKLFASLCGQKAMPHVIFVTTKWSYASRDDGASREEELKREFWKDMLDYGSRIERFDNTYESAWRIIGNLIHRTTDVPFLIQEEMRSGIELRNTRAGRASRVGETQLKMSKGLIHQLRRFFSSPAY